MLISILITNYNKSKYLNKCITSCLNQNYKNFEIVILDNFSTDGSQLLLNRFAKKCILVKKKRVSEYSAVNQINLIKEGIRYCKGKVICLLDSDDYFFKSKLKVIKNFFFNNDKLSIIFDVPIIKKNNYYYKKKIKYFYNKNTWPTIINTSCISIKKVLLQKLIKNNFLNNYPLLEVDFRINAICRILNVEYKIIDENLTVYNVDASEIISKLSKYSRVWWKKRLQAHSFMIDKLKQRGKYYNSFLDHNITRLVNFCITFFGKKSL